MFSVRLIGATLLLCVASLVQGQPAFLPGVIVERAANERIDDPLEALGTLRANEMVNITARVADTVSVVHFEDGQSVASGDVLVELTDAEVA